MVRRLSFVACLLALAGVLVTAGPAVANKPTHFFSRSIGFVCSDVRTSDGAVRIDVEEFTPEFDEPSAGIEYWVAPDTPETDEATFRASSLITDQSISRDGNHFEGTLLMEDRDFNPVGNASFTVDLIPTTDVQDVGGKSKQGNRNIHDKSTIQFFSVSGSLTLHDGQVFDLTDCIGPDGAPSDMAGHDTIIDITQTDPSQFVIRAHDGILVLCDLTGDDYSGVLRASAEETGAGGDLEFSGVGRSLGGEMDSLTLTSEVFAATIPLLDFDTEEPAGEAVVDATLSRDRRLTLRVEENGLRRKLVGWLLSVSGTLTVPTDPATVVDLSSCFAFEGIEQHKEHRPDEIPE